MTPAAYALPSTGAVGSTFFEDLLQLTGDTGARQLLDGLANSITQVDVDDDGIFYNVNRPADL